MVRASGAETITLAGSEIRVCHFGSRGDYNFCKCWFWYFVCGFFCRQTFNLTTQSNITINSSVSRVSGVQNMNNVADNTADLTALGFQDMCVLTLQGAGSGSSVLMNDVSGSGTMALMMTGLAGGFLTNIHNGATTLVATEMTGTIDVGRIDHGGTGAVKFRVAP